MPSFPPSRPPGSSVPAPLRVAASLTGVQGLLTLLYGVAEAVNVQGERVVMGATTALFFVLYGAGLMLCAWGLLRLRIWARGPVLFAQLVWLGLAWNFREGSTLPLAAVLAVVGVLVLAGLVHPRSIAALNEEP